MDYSLPGSCFHRILQARNLEWVAVSFSRGSSRNWVQVSCIAGRLFTRSYKGSPGVREGTLIGVIPAGDFRIC